MLRLHTVCVYHHYRIQYIIGNVFTELCLRPQDFASVLSQTSSINHELELLNEIDVEYQSLNINDE